MEQASKKLSSLKLSNGKMNKTKEIFKLRPKMKIAKVNDLIKQKSSDLDVYYELQCDSISTRRRHNRVEMPKLFQKLLKDMQLEVTHYINILRDSKVVDIMQIFDKLIPFEFYGFEKHKKRMTKIITLILTRGRHECIFKSQLIYDWKIEKVPWLQENTFDLERKKEMLMIGIRIVLSEVVSKLIYGLYTIVPTGATNEIRFVLKVEWQAYLRKVLSKLVKNKYLLSTKQTSEVKLSIKGRLSIKPKGHVLDATQFRPYVRLYKDISTSRFKLKSNNREIYDRARSVDVAKTINFDEHWEKYVSITEGKKIYGVVIDLHDCFSNIPLEKLDKLLENASCSSHDVFKIMSNRIKNQYVHFTTIKLKGRKKILVPKIWKWNHGLLQGDTYSAALCELYVSDLSKKYLQEVNKPECFLHRTVDDFLFCSTDEEDVDRFVQITREKYGGLCEKKMQRYYDESIPYLIYCGREIDVNTKEIYCSFKYKAGTYLRYFTKTWNRNNQVNHLGLIYKCIYFPYNNNYFKKDFYNVKYNSRTAIFVNYYRGMLLIANKFDHTIIAAFSPERFVTNDTIMFEKIISDVMCYYTKKTVQLIGESIKFNELHKIAVLAFIRVLKRRSNNVYKKLVKILTDMSKRNFVEGLDQFLLKRRSKMFDNISVQRKFRPMTFAASED